MPAWLYLVLAGILIGGAVVGWVRQVGAPGWRWAVLLLGCLALAVAGLARHTQADIPGTQLSDQDLSAWRNLAQALGRGAAAQPGQVLVIECQPLPLPELQRLSQARREGFLSAFPAERVDWRVVQRAGYWGLEAAETEVLPRPLSQQRLVVLWDLAPPPGWAKQNNVRLVIVGGGDPLPIKPLRETGEAVCVVAPAMEGATGSTFVLETSEPTVWKLP